MTDTISEHADRTLQQGEALVEMEDVGKTLRRDPGPARDQPHRPRR